MDLIDIWNLIIVGLTRGGLYALMAITLSLMLGVMNVVSMVNGEFFMIGGYVAYFAFVVFGLDPVLAIVFAALITFVVGVLVERGLLLPLRRVSGEGWVMNTWLFTIGLSFVLRNLAQMIWGSEFLGIPGYWEGNIQLPGGVGMSVDRLVAFLIAVFSVVALWYLLSKTRLGRAIRAVNQDERGAMLAGINIEKIYMLTFGLACAMGGIAGASVLSLIPASPYMGVKPMINAWLVVILSGLGNVYGALAGALIVGMTEAVAIQFFGSGWPAVVSACMLILVLLVKPSGIFGSGVKGVWER